MPNPAPESERPMPLPPFADLSGRRAVVTGASSGIGRAIALELARGGADVLIHCRSSVGDAEAVRNECRGLGRKADLLICDFSQVDGLNPFVDEAWTQAGRIDVWVNNAGADLLTGADARLDYGAKLQRLFDIDIRSTMFLSRE